MGLYFFQPEPFALWLSLWFFVFPPRFKMPTCARACFLPARSRRPYPSYQRTGFVATASLTNPPSLCVVKSDMFILQIYKFAGLVS